MIYWPDGHAPRHLGMLMAFGYLAAILLSSGAMLLIDHRFTLYLFARPRRALLIQLIGVGCFLTWDIVCIGLGIFVRGTGPFLTGVELLPHLPVEEPLFLWFLCHFTMIVFCGAAQLHAHRSGRTGDRALHDLGRAS